MFIGKPWKCLVTLPSMKATQRWFCPTKISGDPVVVMLETSVLEKKTISNVVFFAKMIHLCVHSKKHER